MLSINNLAKILKNNDIALAIGLVTVVAMMILPLPAFILDILITVNISLSVIILLVCLYTREPLEYSSFPTILLVSTLFRLGLNVSSTRLILLHGHAGEVIHSFGEFVVGGNYVVGTIIFAILVIINFMVITGGATRVAEVAARFTLDSMPGKQLSIDADLNSGLITEDEAKAKRRKIERESDFYGTMDGASKFVKGDAMAAIVITIINIVGGFIIGIWQMKMDFLTAASTFTILTVGEGLVAQLPALLISTATGLIVSRASGQDKSLSEDINKEMFSDPKVLGVVSGLMLTLGVIPGLPNIPFLTIGGLLGALAYTIYSEMQNKEKEQEKEKTDEQLAQRVSKKKKRASREEVMELLTVEAMEIEIGYRLVPLLDLEQGGDLLERIAQIRKQTALDYGVVLPSIRVRDNLQLAPNSYQIKLKGIPVEKGTVYSDRFLAMNANNDADKYGIKGIADKEPAFGLPAIWIAESDKEYTEGLGFTVVSPSAVVTTHLSEVIKRNISDILTREDVKSLVENVKKVSESLVEDLLKEMNYAEIQIILQNLLKERVSIRDLHTILECLSTFARINKNSDFLTEQCRLALSRSICKQNLADTGELLAITLSPDIEGAIMNGISSDGQNLTLDPVFTTNLIDGLNTEIERAITNTGSQPVILCSAPIRLPFRRLVERTFPQISVMSYNEISSTTTAKSVGIIKIEQKVK
ncbi:MAG: flagellar biosynthesis protein FlhA [Candidatus Gastranaerophilales bacterium]|nr:flagellar biosynthesis protein FlhA [Candidatus Gastranaerophilales bacterium]